MMPSPFRPGPKRVSAELHLTALPTAVGNARLFVHAQLQRWRLERLVDTAELIASELITNSVRATGTERMPHSYTELRDLDLATVILRLRLASTSLFVEVWDRDPNPPVRVVAGDLDENGRGLTLVTAFTKAWDYYPSDAEAGGKVTWGEIEVPVELAGRIPPAGPHQPLPRRGASRWLLPLSASWTSA